jgi:hypothetical protein
MPCDFAHEGTLGQQIEVALKRGAAGTSGRFRVLSQASMLIRKGL